jgi:UDP-N-acetylmuramoyl-L-alanyl-D-glutamate--2,6-diaminopimelate ligase
MEPVKLKTLISTFPLELKGRDVKIHGITADSRTLKPGDLFVVKKPNLYEQQAIDAGAAALFTASYNPFLNIPQIIGKEGLEIELAKKLYGDPSSHLSCFGVTGTKGKTTLVYFLQHLFPKAGLISTVERVIGSKRYPSHMTTYDALANQRFLHEMVEAGLSSAAIEVSSHGLDQGRVDGIAWKAALFTQLAPDHLDYHGTVEAYANVKAKLFEKSPLSILPNTPWGDFMANRALGRVIRYESGPITASTKGIAFHWRGHLFSSPLLGAFNGENLIAGLTLGSEWGLPLSHLQEAVATFTGPPGRLQKVAPQIYIDYAHTKESLELALSALRPLASGRLIVLFGAGGDRDAGRRKGMAEAAEKFADQAILTSDNPRSESAEAIVKEIASYFRSSTSFQIEIDRKRAIQRAIAELRAGDLLLLAGKGHEKVQIVGSKSLPFDEVEIVCKTIENLRS